MACILSLAQEFLHTVGMAKKKKEKRNNNTKTMVNTFLNLVKLLGQRSKKLSESQAGLNQHIQKFIGNCIVIKLLKTSDKEKNLKSSKGKSSMHRKTKVKCDCRLLV